MRTKRVPDSRDQDDAVVAPTPSPSLVVEDADANSKACWAVT